MRKIEKGRQKREDRRKIERRENKEEKKCMDA